MKRLIKFFTLMLMASCVFAQSPEKMSYQAVIRNNSSLLVSNQLVGMRISILKDSANGTPIYIETQTPTTNTNGLASVEIGGGTVVSGVFSAINWGDGPYYIKTETDIAGGTNYTISGTSQLLSVPYALYSKNSGSSIPGPQGPQGIQGPQGPVGTRGFAGLNGQNSLVNTTVESPGSNCLNGGVKIEYGVDVNNNDVLDANEINTQLTKYICNGATGAGGFSHYIGEKFGGGVIFHLWKDSIGTEHGLIVALIDQSNSQIWTNAWLVLIGANAQSTWNGMGNSNTIVNMPGHNSSAAQICLDLVSGGQNDWYLPAMDEMNLLWVNRFNVNKTLSAITGATTIKTNNHYWTSTEIVNDSAWSSTFNYFNPNEKRIPLSVRAIRAF